MVLQSALFKEQIHPEFFEERKKERN